VARAMGRTSRAKARRDIGQRCRETQGPSEQERDTVEEHTLESTRGGGRPPRDSRAGGRITLACADRRDAEGQQKASSNDVHQLVVYMNGVGHRSRTDKTLHGSEQRTPCSRTASKTVTKVTIATQRAAAEERSATGERATGDETKLCIAHNGSPTDWPSARSCSALSARLVDSFAKPGGRWLFAERS